MTGIFDLPLWAPQGDYRLCSGGNVRHGLRAVGRSAVTAAAERQIERIRPTSTHTHRGIRLRTAPPQMEDLQSTLSLRELQNTRVWEELQAVIKSFARDATPSLMLRSKLTLNLCKSHQTHTQHLKTNSRCVMLFPTMQCTWPEPPLQVKTRRNISGDFYLYLV